MRGHRKGFWLVALPLLVAGCSKKPAGEEAPGARAEVPVAPPPAAPPPTVATAAVTQSRPDAKAVVDRWNDLHRQRDVKGLEDVYADAVEFYGQKLPKARVLAMKATAFEKAPDYTQSISGVKMTKPDTDQARAEFTKSWTQGGKTSNTAAVLELKKLGNSFKVTKETDGPSEARLQRQNSSHFSACETAVMNLVANTEPARGLLAGPTDPAHGHPSNGMRISGGTPDEPLYSIGVHESHEDHLATLGWFEVDPKTGAMRESLGERVGPPLPTDSERSRRVREACK